MILDIALGIVLGVVLLAVLYVVVAGAAMFVIRYWDEICAVAVVAFLLALIWAAIDGPEWAKTPTRFTLLLIVGLPVLLAASFLFEAGLVLLIQRWGKDAIDIEEEIKEAQAHHLRQSRISP